MGEWAENQIAQQYAKDAADLRARLAAGEALRDKWGQARMTFSTSDAWRMLNDALGGRETEPDPEPGTWSCCEHCGHNPNDPPHDEPCPKCHLGQAIGAP